MDKFCMALCYAKTGRYKASVDWYEQCLSKTASIGFLRIKEINDSTFAIHDDGFDFLNDPANNKLAQRVGKMLRSFVARMRADDKLGAMQDSAQYFHANRIYYSSVGGKATVPNTLLKKYIDTGIGSYSVFLKKVVSFIIRHGEVIDFTNYGTNEFASSYLDLPEVNMVVDSVITRQFYTGRLAPGTYYNYLQRKAYILNNPPYRQQDSLVYESMYKKEHWSSIIAERQQTGMSIYLDGDDYGPNAFIWQRSPLPWQEKKAADN